MSPTTIIGAAAGAVMLVMSATIWFLYNANEDKAEKLGAYEIAITNYEAADRLRSVVEKIGDSHRQELDRINEKHARQQGQAQAQINIAQLDAAKRAKADPTKFGDNISVFIARVMCRMGADGGGPTRQDCDSAPAEAFTGQFALALTVTPALAAEWAERCDDWRDYKAIGETKERAAFAAQHGVTDDWADFCEWSITGFTEVGVGIIQSWLTAVESKSRERQAWIDNTIKHVDAVNKAKIPDLEDSN